MEAHRHLPYASICSFLLRCFVDCSEVCDEAYYCFFLNRNFNPDHVASIAHTLTSTIPPRNPVSRMTFSLRSVSIPEESFGHETQSIPFVGASARSIRGKSFSRTLRSVVNI